MSLFNIAFGKTIVGGLQIAGWKEIYGVQVKSIELFQKLENEIKTKQKKNYCIKTLLKCKKMFLFAKVHKNV